MAHVTDRNKSSPRSSGQASRRNFLRSGAVLALGLSLPAVPWLTSCRRPEDAASPLWSQLAKQLQGSLLMPGNADFNERALPWALQYASALPQAIAQCATEADVQTCLQWARANGIPLVARSGGHSYGGYSTTSGLMINVSAMNKVSYDASSNRITAGGGARNRNVYDTCKPLDRSITHGRCLEVGVAGLVLGGGIGFNMRAHGYTCDQLRETRVVLADGRILTCNETQNADLFWACRGGGGGNFGIHTSFTFEPFEVDKLTVFDINWTQQLPETFAAIQSVILTAPKSLGMKLSVTAVRQSGTTVLTLAILGQLVGSVTELTNLLAPVLNRYKPDKSDINEMTYWEGQALLSDEGKPEYSHERSRFVKGQLSGEAINQIFTRLKAWPGTSRVATWKYFLLGGTIDAVSSDAMAFNHRGYSMLSSVELEWNPSDEPVLAQNQQWLSQFHDQMETYTSSACYQNFIDPSQSNYLQAYYGPHLPQLQAVKRKYDPDDLFQYPQSIPA